MINYIRQGDRPFLCFYDIEKAFDSVEFLVLLSLSHLFSAGINGKSWRLIKSWYHSPTSCVKHDNALSSSFPICCGVKQGSVLSPSVFLIVMNSLLQRMRRLKCGGSIDGTFAGTAIHADNVRIIAPSIHSVASQFSEIDAFTSDVGLRLNTSKLELIQVSQTPIEPIQVQVGDHLLTKNISARCLGIQWRAASLQVSLLRPTSPRQGRLSLVLAVQGKFNPLSGLSIFETCIKAVKPGY